jgi:DNA segregation ATPase FtsK/SpoIIIE-like protein
MFKDDDLVGTIAAVTDALQGAADGLDALRRRWEQEAIDRPGQHPARGDAAARREWAAMSAAAREDRAGMIDAVRGVRGDMLAAARKVQAEMIQAARDQRTAMTEAVRGLRAAIIEAIHEQTATILAAVHEERAARLEEERAARLEMVSREEDDLYSQAVAIVRESGRGSITLIQTRLGLGYSRAARMVDRMEREGIVGRLRPGGTREVFPSAEDGPPADAAGDAA